ncbi:MAG TPA: transketolase C-terminal domain-containing protein [Candidatus Thermoplasmatota archaeon]|nr:transketolase C-terminal domain-containing protein [Candidatus Thermoplasmatota archaeon]
MSGKIPASFDKPTPTRDGYGAGLYKVGAQDERVVALDADLAESTRSKWFGDAHPSRFFQMGIAEMDMVLTAAGLASAGLRPFASTFAIFTERAFEITRNAVARPNLNVKIVGSHGGIMTGEDGSSAHAIEDVAIYRVLPNFRVVVPADANEAMNAVAVLNAFDGPAYLKLTRQKVPVLTAPDAPFRIGEWPTLREGSDVTFLACGALVSEALVAHDLLKAQGVSARVVNAHTVKPVDVATLERAARETGALVTAEDHSVLGGLGGAVAEAVTETYPVPVKRVGVYDRYIESGLPAELYEKYGLTGKALAEAALEVVKRKR